MRHLILISAVVLLLAGCGREEAPSPQDIAGRTAEQYYTYLLHGDYASFVDGLNYPNPIPKDYRLTLEDNAARFMHDQDSIHGGIKAVHVSKSDLMPADSSAAAVYLMFTYGDSTHEEVLVPMVKRNDVWYMK